MKKLKEMTCSSSKIQCTSKNPSLDNNVKFVRQKPSDVNLKFRLWKMRELASGILDFAEEVYLDRGESIPSIMLCGRHHLKKRESNVLVARGQETGKSFYHNLVTCGSVWRCPVCSYKISKTRQVEVYNFLNYYRNNNNVMTFLTLTMRHKRKYSVYHYLKVLLSEFRKFQNTRRFMEFRKTYIGFIKTLELTYGANGWHPHLHIVFVHEKGVSYDYVDRLLKELLPFWCKRKNINATVRNQVYKQVYTSKDITDYITKWDVSKEITQSNIKQGKNSTTAFGLLADVLDNKRDYEDVRSIYGSYVAATKGRHHIQISRGIKAEYRKVNPVELTDAQIVKNEVVDSFLFSISYDLWIEILHHEIAPLLLSAYDSGGFNKVSLLLTKYKIDHDIAFEKDLKIKFLY